MWHASQFEIMRVNFILKKNLMIKTILVYHGRKSPWVWRAKPQAETKKAKKSAEGGIWTPEPLRERISHAKILSPSRLAGLRYLCNEKFKSWLYNWNAEILGNYLLALVLWLAVITPNIEIMEAGLILENSICVSTYRLDLLQSHFQLLLERRIQNR